VEGDCYSLRQEYKLIPGSRTNQMHRNMGEYLVTTLPNWWAQLSEFQTRGITLIIFCCFPIGYIFAEVFYRFAILVGYMEDINLEAPIKAIDKRITNSDVKIKPGKTSCSAQDEIKQFKTRCSIQRDICFQRVWEWENFQSTFCLYLEATLLVFNLLFGLAIIYTLAFGINYEIFCMIVCFAILSFSIFLWWLMRIARKRKFIAFHHAHKAIEELLLNPNNSGVN
jgi:hypothetical protein